ncbi:MAG: Hint domain-containing protein [Thalassovita sp.]
MNGTFLIFGVDIVADPTLGSTSGVGQDAAGQVTLDAGSQIFGDDQIVEFLFQEAGDNGEVDASTVITGVRVYNSQADFDAGTVLYSYDPATPGVFAPMQTGLDGMGDTYLHFDADVLVSADFGAPALNQLLLAPGTDAVDGIGSLTLDHHEDVDYNDNGVILGGTTEVANGQFNVGFPDFAYNGTALDYVVEGTAGDDYIDDDYQGDPEGDMVDATDAADRSNDDVIDAGAGNDTVYAARGDDSILAGTGNDWVEGFDGDDTVIGDDGDDTFFGGHGNDSFIGGEGNDSFETFYGNDYFSGGAGNDWVNGDYGDDTLIGGDGDDWLRGSFGYDQMWGGEGDDYIWSGYNDDTISLENNFGNDTIIMEDQAEVYGDVLDLSAITDNLTIDLSQTNFGVGLISDGVSTANFEAVEHLVLGSGIDTIVLADVSGYDAVEAFSGPILNPDGTYTGVDQVDVSQLHDTDGFLVNTDDVTVTDDGSGNAVLNFPTGEQLVLGGVAPADLATPEALNAIGIPLPTLDGIVEGTDEDDVIDGGYVGDPDQDRIDAEDAIDPLAGSNDDVVQAGEGNDTVRAGEGNDVIYGGAGNDMLQGDVGNDSLTGGAGNDFLSGGEGNDTFNVGSGDTALGDDGDDVFVVDDANRTGSDFSIIAGEGGETDGDTLIVNGAATITYDAGDPEAGTVTWADGSTLSFWEIERVKHVPCFTEHSMIKTRRGEVAAARLRVNDYVLTRDEGFQPIRWIGARRVPTQELSVAPSLRPVRIKAGALGSNVPERDLLVSPQHRMLISDPKVGLWFGDEEVFVPAIHLTCLPGVEQLGTQQVTYVHFMFDQHQIVQGDGAWSESFQPGDMSLASMDAPQRQELFTLFPELKDLGGAGRYPAARATLTAQEARVLFS